MKTFFAKHYKLFLLLIVLVSYGQLLGMYVWQDDNALFFKLAHVEENAGYLAAGPFGIGPYKYIATPYIPIYKFFGFNTVPYFALSLSFYFLATLAVYKVFSEMLGKKGGRVAGFLFAAGYVASDGFIRLFNSVNTGTSIILIAGLTLFYWRFRKQKNYKWYLLAILFYFLAVEFARLRTHYLIGVVLAFELIFLAFKKFPKSLLDSAVRVLPFAFIFYHYFIANADHRSGRVGEFVEALLRGEFHQVYSWFSSLARLIFPDWFTPLLFKQNMMYLWPTAVFVLAVIFYLLFKKKPKRKMLTITFSLTTLVWLYIARNIFSTPVLNLAQQQLFIAFLGGVVILLSAAIYLVIDRQKRKLFLFFSLWVLVNIGAYAAYQPTVSYETVNRLLAHSFFALVGVFALLFLSLQGKEGVWSNLASGLILVWGFTNMVTSVIYQNKILRTRSLPAKNFYKQLKVYVRQANKGDVFYFDVADNARGYFTEAFSVASMPETTAIAWRYGLDRYDIVRVTKFTELIELIKKEEVKLGNVRSFFYSKEGLIDTTEKLQQFLETQSLQKDIAVTSRESPGQVVVNLDEAVVSITPVEIEFEISALPLKPSQVEFPYIQDARFLASKIANNMELRQLAFEYGRAKNNLLKQSKVTTSSDWQKRVASNLVDQDPNTAWQADRVLWGKGEEARLVLDLGALEEIDRFIWVNAFGNNTPTKYSIEVSLDSVNWREVKSVSSLIRIDTKDPQIVKFEPQKARFVRMTVFHSLSNDSPGISEVWVVPAYFGKLDIKDTEKFLKVPFGYVADAGSFEQTLSHLKYRGDIQVSWLSDKGSDWITNSNSKISVAYDGVSRSYKILLPAGGTRISKIKLSNAQIPGNISLRSIWVRYPALEELSK